MDNWSLHFGIQIPYLILHLFVAHFLFQYPYIPYVQLHELLQAPYHHVLPLHLMI
jgi:hypothetical protein